MTAALTPMEMFNELVRLGYVVPANFDPAGWMMPTAYISVPTSTAFTMPPINGGNYHLEIVGSNVRVRHRY